MIKNNKQQLIGGIITSFLVWTIFVIADYIDENIIDKGYYIGLFVFILLPIVMLICYVRFYIVNRPNLKKIFVWFGSYYISFFILWLLIYILYNNDMFITQKYSEGWDLNGMEYLLFGVSPVLIFSVACIIFHIIYGLVNLVKKRRK
ncbi:MAG: hypothetical protein IKL73_04350 [Lachnospiraceae bacterium]|nr:hypothetical protein [Lachnospiraceae bacterium]